MGCAAGLPVQPLDANGQHRPGSHRIGVLSKNVVDQLKIQKAQMVRVVLGLRNLEPRHS